MTVDLGGNLAAGGSFGMRTNIRFGSIAEFLQ
jgi:hypothetical protein